MEVKKLFFESFIILRRQPMFLLLSAIPFSYTILVFSSLKIVSERYTDEKFYVSLQVFSIISSLLLLYSFLGIISALSINIRTIQFSYKDILRLLKNAILNLLKLYSILLGIFVVLAFVILIGGNSHIIWIFLIALTPVGILLSIILPFSFSLLLLKNYGWKNSILNSYLLLRENWYLLGNFLLHFSLTLIIWGGIMFAISFIPIIGPIILFGILIFFIAYCGVLLGLFISEIMKESFN